MQAKCPACSTLLNIPDHLAGKPVKCQCGKVFKCSPPKRKASFSKETPKSQNSNLEFLNRGERLATTNHPKPQSRVSASSGITKQNQVNLEYPDTIPTKQQNDAQIGAAGHWYVALGTGSEGPFEFQEITKKIAVGEITADCLLWTSKLAGWTPTKQIPELSSFVDDTQPIWLVRTTSETNSPVHGPISKQMLLSGIQAGQFSQKSLIQFKGEQAYVSIMSVPVFAKFCNKFNAGNGRPSAVDYQQTETFELSPSGFSPKDSSKGMGSVEGDSFTISLKSHSPKRRKQKHSSFKLLVLPVLAVGLVALLAYVLVDKTGQRVAKANLKASDNSLTGSRDKKVDHFQWNGIGIGSSRSHVWSRKNAIENELPEHRRNLRETPEKDGSINIYIVPKQDEYGVGRAIVNVEKNRVVKLTLEPRPSQYSFSHKSCPLFTKCLIPQLGHSPNADDLTRKSLLSSFNRDHLSDTLNIWSEDLLYTGQRDFIIYRNGYGYRSGRVEVIGYKAGKLMNLVSALKQLDNSRKEKAEQERIETGLHAIGIAIPLTLLIAGVVFGAIFSASKKGRGGAVIIGNDDNDDGILDVFQGGGF